MPGKIPDRWEEYTAMGKPIGGTRFISFKVPLEEKMVASLEKDEQFTPQMLIEKTKETGSELGLIIDLTNTTRYYSKKEIIDKNIQYSKVYTEGHVVPSSKVRQKFFSIIDKFLEDSSNDGKLIGIHCTHGINRTGYLVCRYMIDKLGFDPEKALEAFGDARGYPIERQNYIDDLKSPPGEDNEEMEEENEETAEVTNGITVISRRVDRRGDQYRNNGYDNRNGNFQRRHNDNRGRGGWVDRRSFRNDRFSGHEGRNPRDRSGGYQNRGQNNPTDRYQNGRQQDRYQNGRQQGYQDRYSRGRQHNYQDRYQGYQQNKYQRGLQQDYSQDRYQRGQQDYSQDRYQRGQQDYSQDRYQRGQQQDYSQDRYQRGQQQQDYTQDRYQRGQQQDYSQDRYQRGQQQDYSQDRYQRGQQQGYSQDRHQWGQQQAYSQDTYQRSSSNSDGWNSQGQSWNAYQRAGWT